MTNPTALSREELEGLVRVIEHPAHQAGLEDRRLTVVRVERRGEALLRLVGTLSGDDELVGWDTPNATVRIELPEAPAEFAGVDGAPSTTSRVYTIADVDLAGRRIDIDLVDHPEPSPAMRWIHTARPGETVRLKGPRPHRVPGAGDPRILLADSSALPAALSIVTRMPHGGSTLVLAAAPEDEVALFRDDASRVSGASDGLTVRAVDPTRTQPLATAFAQLDVPADATVWAAGERDDVREVRRRCREDLRLPRERTEVFGYWKHGMSNTRIDLARLQAARRTLDSGGAFGETDDLEIGL